MKNSNHNSGNKRHHFGPFLTWIAEQHSDTQMLLQTSRRARKGLTPLAVSSADVDPYVAISEIRHDWKRLWALHRVGWWIGVLFMIGSALFAIGGAMGTWPEMPVIHSIDKGYAGWIFFVGSLFFTAAGYLQWLEAICGDVAETRTTRPARRRWLFCGWHPRNLGYLAVAAQLIGTLFFNVNTADALISGFGWAGEDILVWTPNIMGSICFLIASYAAVIEVSHRFWSWQPRDLSWWITAINMLGSVFFMISAVGSFVEPGHVLAAPWLANFGTFAGGVCFFVGGYLLIPEQSETLLSTPNVETELV